MKKLLILLFILTSGTSFGQFKLGTSFYYGKSELLNDLKPVRNETYFVERGNSYQAGLQGEYALNKWLSIQTDILYDQINSEQFYRVNKDDLNSSRRRYAEQLEYLSFPIMLQLNYKKMKLNVGHQTSFLISNSRTYHEVHTLEERRGTNKNTDIYLKRNMSLVAALSYNVYKNIHLETRFVKGYSNIMNEDAGYVYKARSIQYLVGLNIDLFLSKNSK